MSLNGYACLASSSVVTSVGAILLLLTVSRVSGSDPVAGPVSLLPRTAGAASVLTTITLPDIGVWGGVANGTVPMDPACAAAMLGRVLNTGAGLIVTASEAGVCARDICVATDEAEFDRVGLKGRIVAKGDAEGGFGFDGGLLTEGG